jgi:hypothetical protein
MVLLIPIIYSLFLHPISCSDTIKKLNDSITDATEKVSSQIEQQNQLTNNVSFMNYYNRMNYLEYFWFHIPYVESVLISSGIKALIAFVPNVMYFKEISARGKYNVFTLLNAEDKKVIANVFLFFNEEKNPNYHFIVGVESPFLKNKEATIVTLDPKSDFPIGIAITTFQKKLFVDVISSTNSIEKNLKNANVIASGEFELLSPVPPPTIYQPHFSTLDNLVITTNYLKNKTPDLTLLQYFKNAVANYEPAIEEKLGKFSYNGRAKRFGTK